MSYFKAKIRRLRFWWRLTTAYLSKYKLRIIIWAIVFTAAVISLFKLFPFITQKNVLNIGIVGTYSIETIPANILSLATQPLITTDQSGKPQPALVKNWTISEDNKSYVLFLKDDIKWHDESEVDARQISVAIKNVNITYLNQKALKLDLENPLSSFLTILNKPVFKANSFYGTGPERIVAIDKSEDQIKKMSLVPNDKNLPKVNLKFYQIQEQAINAFKMGEIKVLDTPSPQNLENWPNIETQKNLDDSGIVTVFFNVGDNLLSSRELRQALTHAINKEKFDGKNSYSPISQSSWAYNESIKRYDFNPSKAKELVSKSEVKNLKITLSYAPIFKEVAESIQKDWQAIGVEVTLKEEQQLPKNFQAYLTTNKLPADPDQYTLWHSTQIGKGNITALKDDKIDKLLEDGRTEKDEAKRKEYYFEFQRFLVEDAPAAFLYYPYKYRLVYKNVKTLMEKLPD